MPPAGGPIAEGEDRKKRPAFGDLLAAFRRYFRLLVLRVMCFPLLWRKAFFEGTPRRG